MPHAKTGRLNANVLHGLANHPITLDYRLVICKSRFAAPIAPATRFAQLL
jgi:hypothetical protein